MHDEFRDDGRKILCRRFFVVPRALVVNVISLLVQVFRSDQIGLVLREASGVEIFSVMLTALEQEVRTAVGISVHRDIFQCLQNVLSLTVNLPFFLMRHTLAPFMRRG